MIVLKGKNMLNLIKNELIKLFKRKDIYILLIIRTIDYYIIQYISKSNFSRKRY